MCCVVGAVAGWYMSLHMVGSWRLAEDKWDSRKH